MSNLKAIIFDLDGVIVDSEPVYHQIFQQWLRDQQFDTELISPLGYVGATWAAILEQVKIDTKTDLDLTAAEHNITDRILRYIVEVGMPLKDEIARTLTLLQPHFKLGVASNSARAVVERILQHHGLFDYFSTITSVHEIQYPKPHPEPYLKTMQMLKVTPDETIIIEDSLIGATAAVASGAFTYIWPDHRFPAEKFAPILRTNGKVIYGFDTMLQDLGY